MSFDDWIRYVISLFVISSPVTAIPVLIALTPKATTAQRKLLGAKIGIASGIILVITAWFGGALLSFLQIKVASFQVTGGLVVLLLGLSMLSGNNVNPNNDLSEDMSGIVVVPMAIPLLAGPGAISTVIVKAGIFNSFFDRVLLSIGALTMGAMIAALLYFSTSIAKLLGQKGLNVATKIGGLILIALAVEALSNGIAGLFACYAA